ncbi:MAG TPA: hypothetical protein VK858_14895 [Longimicrobiales bacterium]|nr:hypothetical protein [Longimicrobiales bacterium]
MLAAWPSYVVDAREDQDAAARVVEARAFPLLSSNLSLGPILAESFPWRSGQAVTGVAPVTPSLELLNAVAERRFWNGMVISELESLRAIQDSITTRLPSPLPRR